ncbi:MAG: MFS transporter [Eubacteriales bacterium]|jgi:fucose permease|nr:MFS transporter [Eubacteriales bacterium]
MESSRENTSSRRSVRLLTAGIVMLIAVYGLLSNYQSVVLNSVVESYRLTGGAQGIMSSMINIGAVAAFITAPMLQGRIKKTTMLLLGAAVLVVSFFLLGEGRVVAGLIAACLLTGVGFGWVDANCNAVMVDLHHDKSAKFLGLLHGGFGVGGLIAPILISALLAVMSWHTVSYLMGALIALAGVAFLLLLGAAKKGVPPVKKEQPLTFAAVKAFLFQRKNALMLLASILYAIAQSGLLIWIVRYMTLRYNAEALGSIALSIYWVCATLSRFFAPRLPIRPLKLFLLGVLLTCVFQAVGVFSGSAVVMCVMSGVIGLVSGHCVPMILSEASADNPGVSSLIASSFLISIFATNSVAPLFMGALASWAGLDAMMLAPAVSAAFSALIVLIILRQERKKRAQALA